MRHIPLTMRQFHRLFLILIGVMCVGMVIPPLHRLSAAQVTATPLPVFPPTNTPRPTRTPTMVLTPTPTFTLTVAAQATSAPIPAGLCSDCSRVRVRATPGTAGNIVIIINSDARFNIIGRTEDSEWIQIMMADGVSGWIAARFARGPNGLPFEPSALSGLAVMGVAVEASPTPTSEFLASVPGWLTGISSRSREIYLRGQAMGNRRSVFSKVGDSITASANFLYPFGFGQYNLASYSGYSGAIGAFGTSFVRESIAAAGGWTANQLLAQNSPCGPETPLACELRTNKPAVALIMIGTNDSGSGSPDVFAGQLQQIVQITIDHGVIPVLSTIPPKSINDDQTARVKAFNAVIVQIARQNDIPLWDYYSNMVGLPNQGMSSDGLHPSVSPVGSGILTADSLQYGFTVRNRDALIVLDTMLRYIMY